MAHRTKRPPVIFVLPGISIMELGFNDATGTTTVRCPGCGAVCGRRPPSSKSPQYAQTDLVCSPDSGCHVGEPKTWVP